VSDATVGVCTTTAGRRRAGSRLSSDEIKIEKFCSCGDDDGSCDEDDDEANDDDSIRERSRGCVGE